jgi:hypothetical protein
VPNRCSAPAYPLGDGPVGLRDDDGIVGLLHDRRQAPCDAVGLPQPVRVQAEEAAEDEERQRPREIAGGVGRDVAGHVPIAKSTMPTPAAMSRRAPRRWSASRATGMS